MGEKKEGKEKMWKKVWKSAHLVGEKGDKT